MALTPNGSKLAGIFVNSVTQEGGKSCACATIESSRSKPRRDLTPLRQRTAWHELGHVVASRAMDFPISCATIEPNKWFSGRCLAPLSPADDLPEQQIASAQAICDQVRALIGDTLGQDPMESAEWRTDVHARCTILAAGNCAEQLAFPDTAPLDNGMDRALSRIYARSVCAPSAIESFLEYARQEAAALLVSQRHVLEALAEAMEAHGSLTGPEEDAIIALAVQTRFLAQEHARREAMLRMTARASAFLKEHENGHGISPGSGA